MTVANNSCRLDLPHARGSRATAEMLSSSASPGSFHHPTSSAQQRCKVRDVFSDWHDHIAMQDTALERHPVAARAIWSFACQVSHLELCILSPGGVTRPCLHHVVFSCCLRPSNTFRSAEHDPCPKKRVLRFAGQNTKRAAATRIRAGQPCPRVHGISIAAEYLRQSAERRPVDPGYTRQLPSRVSSAPFQPSFPSITPFTASRHMYHAPSQFI